MKTYFANQCEMLGLIRLPLGGGASDDPYILRTQRE